MTSTDRPEVGWPVCTTSTQRDDMVDGLVRPWSPDSESQADPTQATIERDPSTELLYGTPSRGAVLQSAAPLVPQANLVGIQLLPTKRSGTLRKRIRSISQALKLSVDASTSARRGLRSFLVCFVVGPIVGPLLVSESRRPGPLCRQNLFAVLLVVATIPCLVDLASRHGRPRRRPTSRSRSRSDSCPNALRS